MMQSTGIALAMNRTSGPHLKLRSDFVVASTFYGTLRVWVAAAEVDFSAAFQTPRENVSMLGSTGKVDK
jgi:hypothetical protein